MAEVHIFVHFILPLARLGLLSDFSKTCICSINVRTLAFFGLGLYIDAVIASTFLLDGVEALQAILKSFLKLPKSYKYSGLNLKPK